MCQIVVNIIYRFSHIFKLERKNKNFLAVDPAGDYEDGDDNDDDDGGDKNGNDDDDDDGIGWWCARWR